ncbi:MAG: HEAT repeat domain-containing protein [Planctomycetota bacterium]|nr:HEAT repeat domain-containing protein [Planctomycetota bacterium]
MLKRTSLTVFAVLLATAIFAGDLWAHGGQFRGPGGAVPPGMREPSDPTPPPPPPPSGPPTTPSTPTTPSGPGPSMPSTPTTGPTTPTPSSPASPQGGPKGPASLGFENWVFWYHNNKEDIEQLKSALYSSVSSESVIFDLGGRSRSNRSDAMHDIRAKVESAIIPALRWAMDKKNSSHQDTESAAYIALAKMAKDPNDITVIKKGLDPKLKKDLIVQESTALALGMLRRANEENQFTAKDLDGVREFLFDCFQSKDYQTRTRGFCALAIGLLGDQPTGSKDYIEGVTSSTDAATDDQVARAATSSRLFELLKGNYSNQDLYIGLLMAIGLQRADSISEEQREVLRQCVTKGKLFKNDVNNFIRSYAALQLGRIGTAKDVTYLERALTSRRSDVNIQRSAAIGLGVLSKLIPSKERVNVANVLLTAIQKKKVKDASAVNFSYISLGYLLIEDIKANKTDVIEQTKAADFLMKEASSGRILQRPFAALSLALCGKQIGETPDLAIYGDFRQKSLETLRAGLSSKKLDKRGRAGFACSLGIIKDEGSVKALQELVADRKEDHELRGYAALGLGLIGYAPKQVTSAIRDALKERRSEEMRQQCATALGLLKDKEAINLLLEELKRAKSQSVKGQVVLAIAKIGTESAVDPLVALLKNESKKEQDLTRALACAGLGVIGDLELIPSLSRISKNINYRASTDLINEVLSII